MFQTLQRWLGNSERRPVQTQRTNLRLESLDARIVPSAAVMRSGSTLVINGTRADDHVVVSSTAAGITVDFNGTTQSFAANQIRGIQFRGGDGNDWLQNGTSLKMNAEGGNGDDSVFGGGGDDLINGGNGNDSLRGGSGRDSLNGQNGDDDLFGDAGDDRLLGGSGRDDMSGDDGNDSVNGDSGDDSLFGGLGDDSLNGGGGDDSCNGASGRDRIRGGGGNDSSIFDSSDLSDDSRRHHGALAAGMFAEVEGSISAISGNDVTIRTRSGALVTVHVTANTSLEVNGNHVAFTAFRVGMPAEAKFNPTTFDAFELESGHGANSGGGNSGGGNSGGQEQGSRFEGRVIAVGANSVTLRRSSGVELTVTVSATTKIERNELHVPLSAIQVGDFGEVRYDPTTLIATKVESVG